MSSNDSICPVCKQQGCSVTDIPSSVLRTIGRVQETTDYQGVSLYECTRCGRFAVTRHDVADFLENETQRERYHPLRLSALLREQTISKLPSYWVRFGTKPYGPLQQCDLAPIDVDELLTRWPRTVSERLNRTLCNLARLSPNGGHRVDFDSADTSLACAETGVEAGYNFRCLKKLELVDDKGSLDRAESHVTLTAKGWERFEELTKESSPDNAVFVAMWYGVDEKTDDEDKTKEEMDLLYNDGIRRGIEDAGYQAKRVDSTPHNDWIMNEMLGLIRLAPFVVADFTGHRNGVYFEAGFAHGLGKTVIHTCEKGAFEKAHFDTKQLNHVLWTTPEELRASLCAWISGSIGWGPHPSPSVDS